jgi:hypothetical protein
MSLFLRFLKKISLNFLFLVKTSNYCLSKCSGQGVKASKFCYIDVKFVTGPDQVFFLNLKMKSYFNLKKFSRIEDTDPGIITVCEEVTFWNSAEYGILCRSDFTSAEFHGIPYNSAEFRVFFLYMESQW